MNYLPLFLLLITAGLGATNSVPHATGRVELNPETGFIKGEICLTNRPGETGNAFMLTAGLNIAHVRAGFEQPSLGYDGFFNGEIYGDGRLYSVDIEPDEPLCVEYVGAAPVYPERDAFLDWKGRLATDGTVFRLTEQTAWIPLPINKATGQIFNQITYDLDITCTICETLYLSGTDPIAAQNARFENDNPVQPILLAGQYQAQNLGQLWALDSEISSEKAVVLSRGFNQIKQLQSEYLNLPYGQTPVFIEFDSLDNVRLPKRGWGFVSWPTIAFGGVEDLEALAGAFQAEPSPKTNGRIGYIAHEAAHYYFGTYHQPTGTYAPLFLESAAEYMSIVTLLEMFDENVQMARLNQLADELFAFEEALDPLHKINAPPDQKLAIWRYVYGPLVLQSVADVIGDDEVRALLSAMAKAEKTPSDWNAFTDLALNSGISANDWDRWVANCLAPELVDSCLIRYLSTEGLDSTPAD